MIALEIFHLSVNAYIYISNLNQRCTGIITELFFTLADLIDLPKKIDKFECNLILQSCRE